MLVERRNLSSRWQRRPGTWTWDQSSPTTSRQEFWNTSCVPWTLTKSSGLFRNTGGLFRQPLGPDGFYRSTVFPGLWLDPVALVQGNTRRLRAVVDLGLASPEHADFVARLANGTPGRSLSRLAEDCRQSLLTQCRIGRSLMFLNQQADPWSWSPM